jgi:hypothetical protein
MVGILADVDIEGHVAVLLRLLHQEPWRELWLAIDVASYDFQRLGLPREAPDAVVWRLCQEREIVLVTGNRNADEPDSLEATICAENHASCLPVLTLADPKAVLADHGYAEGVASRLLDVFFDIENLRGTGRLFLP